MDHPDAKPAGQALTIRELLFLESLFQDFVLLR